VNRTGDRPSDEGRIRTRRSNSNPRPCRRGPASSYPAGPGSAGRVRVRSHLIEVLSICGLLRPCPAVATTFAALLASRSAAKDGRPFRACVVLGVRGGVLPLPRMPPGSGTLRRHGQRCAPLVGLDRRINGERGPILGIGPIVLQLRGVPLSPFLDWRSIRVMQNLLESPLHGMLVPMQSPRCIRTGLGVSLNQFFSLLPWRNTIGSRHRGGGQG